jgi:hypothetical protein
VAGSDVLHDKARWSSSGRVAEEPRLGDGSSFRRAEVLPAPASRASLCCGGAPGSGDGGRSMGRWVTRVLAVGRAPPQC